MDIVKRIKPMYNRYVINIYVKKHNKVILRLLPYHCEFNPIELVWSVVKKHAKSNNSTFKLQDVHKLIHNGIDLKCGKILLNIQKKKQRKILGDQLYRGGSIGDYGLDYNNQYRKNFVRSRFKLFKHTHIKVTQIFLQK